jgi:hypothetical protein
MEFNKNLLKTPKKSKVRIIFGIAFIVFSCIWISLRLMDNLPIRFFDWLYSGVFSLNGVIHIMAGFGYSIEGVFGKAFIKIDSEFINVKLGSFEKESKISWQAITSIDYKPTLFRIHKIDNTTQVVEIEKLDYSGIQEVKDVISKIAEDKKLNYTIK